MVRTSAAAFAGAAWLLVGPLQPAGVRAAEMGIAANVVPLTVETPLSGFNRLTVSVTICEPSGSAKAERPSSGGRCATIDHIMVDTGSNGLRLQAHAVPSFLRLPAVVDDQGRRVAECLRFLGSAAWGGLHRADVHLGGMAAAAIPVQIVGDDLPRAASCPSPGHPTSNGTLGIGLGATDCDGDCLQSRVSPTYMACDGAGCAAIQGGVPAALKAANPVQRFDAHNDGVVLDLPMPARRGVAAVAGELIFGVNTAANNQLLGARALRLDRTGHFTTRFDGVDYPRSYIDSGTEYLLVPSADLPLCRPGAAPVCAEPTRTLSAAASGIDGAEFSWRFLAGRFPNREHGVFAAAVMAAAPDSRSFVWGAPFFMGRRVALVFRDRTVPGTPAIGPFYAVLPGSPP